MIVDENNSIEQQREDFYKVAKEALGSPTGKELVKFLERTYVDPSCVGETTEITYFNLGQQELAKFLIQLSRGE
jgi:hypothetical protein